jgi:hypothetical protein
MNQNHHNEQMEALRRDFEELWQCSLKERSRKLEIPDALSPATKDIAWQAFRASRKPK